MGEPEPLPSDLASLVAELERDGFRVVNDEESEQYFGNRLIELVDDDRPAIQGIRLVKDRGLWDVEIQLFGGWHNSYHVAQAQRGAKYSQRAQSHKDRHDFTLEAVQAMPDSDEDLGPILERLDEYRRAYWERFQRAPDE